MDVNSAHV